MLNRMTDASAPSAHPRARILLTLISVSYPPALYLCVTRWGIYAAAVVTVAAFVPALLLHAGRKGKDRRGGGVAARLYPVAVLLGLAALAMGTREPRYLMALPTLISFALLAVFGSSLRTGKVPVIERVARVRRRREDLADFVRSYCRRVTQVWCVFFLANGAVAGALAVWAPLAWWTLYTSLIAYLVMAALFGVERVVRSFLVYRRIER